MLVQKTTSKYCHITNLLTSNSPTCLLINLTGRGGNKYLNRKFQEQSIPKLQLRNLENVGRGGACFFCQAQFQSSPSPVQLELRLALSLIITTPIHPPTRDSRDAA